MRAGIFLTRGGPGAGAASLRPGVLRIVIPDAGAPRRVVVIDVLRGLVVLMLVPDLSGGFSMPRMAENHPDSDWLRAIGHQLSHSPWQGVTVWDLVMPLFVFVMGASMALSDAARRHAGMAEAERWARAVLRSISLVVLGLQIAYGVREHADGFMVALVLATGLPWSRWSAWVKAYRLDLAGALVVVLMALGWMWAHPARWNAVELHQILILMGLAYLPAYALHRSPTRIQILAAVAVVVAHGAAHALYAWAQGLTANAVDLREWLGAGWLKGHNLAAALDLRWLNALPRTEPYLGNAVGYHSLQAMPLVALILAGAVWGRALSGGMPVPELAARSARWGLGALALAGLGVWAGVPLLKILWTPSWSALAIGFCLLVSALLLQVGDERPRRAMDWRTPLLVLGSNALLLYVLVAHERWRLLLPWRALLELPALAPARPLAESLAVLVTLLALAALLHRRGLLLRI
jgi:predicted acyltransferase